MRCRAAMTICAAALLLALPCRAETFPAPDPMPSTEQRQVLLNTFLLRAQGDAVRQSLSMAHDEMLVIHEALEALAAEVVELRKGLDEQRNACKPAN